MFKVGRTVYWADYNVLPVAIRKGTVLRVINSEDHEWYEVGGHSSAHCAPEELYPNKKALVLAIGDNLMQCCLARIDSVMKALERRTQEFEDTRKAMRGYINDSRKIYNDIKRMRDKALRTK
jgi:hypothetical protein